MSDTEQAPSPDTAWPVKLSFDRGEAELLITFDDGFSSTISFELLRVESPSAETKGHGGQRPPPPAGKRDVSVQGAEPIGRYAVRILFSDGHDTGLYSWTYLRDLAENQDARMADYLERLKAAGLSRD
ncbi:MAG: DUF971 domain-containing protein [Pseudomonadota bacterium]